VRHLHTDHLGTPRELTDADGRVVWAARYRAWGNVLQVVHDEVSTTPAVEGVAEELGSAQPVRFQGQYFDDETGLHYNRFRYYDPDVGRFISIDPIGLIGGINTYRYASNPIYWVDPLGLAPCDSTAGGEANTSATVFGPPRMGLNIPQGLRPSTFDRVSANVRAAIDRMGLGDDVFVMGSRAGGTAKVGSDLDIGIRMAPEQFDQMIAKSFAGAKNARAATMDVAIRDGRIQAGEAGLRSLGKSVASEVGLPPGKVQISVIRAGGVFDNGPQTPLAYTFK
jgi:RHS repeat-associated protein